MSQLHRFAVSSRFFIFIAVFLFPVYLAFPMEKFIFLKKRSLKAQSDFDLGDYYDELSLLKRSLLGNQKYEVLRNHPDHEDRYGESLKSHQPHVKSKEYSQKKHLSSDQIFKTSCRKITCEYVKNYPTDLIERAFNEKFQDKLPGVYIPSSGTEQKTEVIKEFSQDELTPTEKTQQQQNIYPSPDFVFPSDNYKTYNEPEKMPIVIGRSMAQPINDNKRRTESKKKFNSSKKNNKNHLLQTKRPNCDEQIRETYPKEAINMEFETVLLVNIPLHVIRTTECKAERFCKDDRTPEDHVNECKSRIVEADLQTYNNKTSEIVIQTVHITNGCQCELIRHP